MKKLLSKIRTALLLTGFVGIFSLLAIPRLALAQAADPTNSSNPTGSNTDSIKNSVCQGISLTGTDCPGADSGASGLQKTIQLVINILSVLVGVAAVIMIIIGGFKYITSSGDSNNIQGAKNTILFAVVGLIIVVLAQVIVRFVIGKVNHAATSTTSSWLVDRLFT